MNLIKSTATFLLKGNIFIAFCAVGLSIETSLLLQRPCLYVGFYSFIFFACLFTYNAYYFKSKFRPHASWLMIVGLIGATSTIFYVPLKSVFFLILVSVLSGIYLLPAYISIRQSVLFTVQKLGILILVWVLMTFMVPAPDIHFDVETTLLLLWRILLMSHLCLLFLIKDETHSPVLKQLSIHACVVMSILQLLLATIIFFIIGKGLGGIYFVIAMITAMVSRSFNLNKKTDLHYLFFVDGIMILQTIFVLIKFVLIK